MAYRRILLPWDSQPQEAVAVNWSHPLARGLDYVCLNGVEFVRGRATGLVQAGASGQGLTERGSVDYVASADVVACTVIGHHYYTSDNADYAGLVWGYYSGGGDSSQLGIGMGAFTGPQIYGVNRANSSGTTVLETVSSFPYSAVWGISGTFGSGAATTAYRNGIPFASVAQSGSAVFATDTRRRLQKFAATSTGKSSAWVFKWGRLLSAEEHLAVYERPWVIFEPQTIWAPVSAGGAVTLVVQDAAHGHAADGTTITTSSLLGVQDAAHAHSADGITLAAGLLLTTADAAHAHASDGPALTLDTHLAVADAVHGHHADGPSLTVSTHLAVADAAHAHTSEAPALTVSSYLAVSDALHGHAPDNLDLSGAPALSIADARHAHLADIPTLTAQSALAIADALHAHAAEALALGLLTSLTVADAAHAHAVDNITLTFGYPAIFTADSKLRLGSAAVRRRNPSIGH